MKKCDYKLKIENDNIVKYLDELRPGGRARTSTNILLGLRNFVEHVMLKIYCDDNNLDLDDRWTNLVSSSKYCATKGQCRFICSFVKDNLNSTSGHKTISEDYSEAIVLIYYEKLIKIKTFMKDNYNVDLLQNIEKYPLDLDNTYLNHYRKIWNVIDNIPTIDDISSYNDVDMYYVQKKKPIYFDGHLLYELVLTSPTDDVDKLDRFVVFSKVDVFRNYAIKAIFEDRSIEVFGEQIPIKIIKGYSISIRMCELDNLAHILDYTMSNSRTIEYRFFMSFIKSYGVPLSYFLDLSNEELKAIQDSLEKNRAVSFNILKIIKKAKSITDANKPGANVIRYLMYSMRNRIIKAQYSMSPNPTISNLLLENGVLFFDNYPYCCNLIGSKQTFSEVFDCIPLLGKEHQLLNKELRNSSDETGRLYLKIDELEYKGDVDEAIQTFNDKLNEKSKKLAIEKYGKNVFLKEDELSTIDVINALLRKTRIGIPGYEQHAKVWVDNNKSNIYGDQKVSIIKSMFSNTRVYLIYGAAGTGKSTMINFIFDLFGKNISKLCLAPTHPALENMRRRINDSTAKSCTIQSFTRNPLHHDEEYDVTVVDECSVVSNRLMRDLLICLKTKVLVLSGDIYQIPSIDFGNWFHLASSFLPDHSKCELVDQYRTTDEVLKELWSMVRSFDNNIEAYLANNGLVSPLCNDVFVKKDEDEVVLCLNYDGLFGVNNINIYLQTTNPNPPVRWYHYIFKVGDPILFLETRRFKPILFNNLKGIIKKIDVHKDRITFDVAIERSLSSLNFHNDDIQFIGSENGWTIVRFSVYAHDSSDYDRELSSRCFVPFHIAYAVSIHKAQGLEYNSVKVVLANNVEDNINHNIFYTAITRAKKKLMIYWTPETEKAILSSFEKRFNETDYLILKNRIKVV